MCAIAGEIDFTKQPTGRSTHLMLKEMFHRGPDGRGFYKDKNLYFGMNRLAIVDLSTGDQPLYNEDKNLVIVGNGEIYNYPQLQKLLHQKGHKLKSGSDIETAVHLYEEYGEKFVKYLRGMFALAIYDKNKNKVILVRDRIGEKPLYYYHADKNFYFASELKALLKLQKIDKSISKENLVEYMCYAYINEPKTAFRNIHKIPPAHMMVIDVASNLLSLKQYWDIPPTRKTNEKNTTQNVFKAIKDACIVNSRADVPVGISLSGGIDSTAVLSFSVHPKENKPAKAFSVGYEGTPKTDERKFAKESAEYYKVASYSVELSPDKFVADYTRLIAYCDDPVADLAAYSIYSVAKLCRQKKTKVLLGGLGGDELFWGYQWVNNATQTHMGSSKSKFSLYRNGPTYKRFDAFTKQLLTTESKNLLKNIDMFDERTKHKKTNVGRTSANQLMRGWLTANCLTLADRLGMANSVEMRSPLVDYKLVELAYRNKANIESFSLPTKYWMKRALQKTLPDKILNKTKQGFTPPVAQWLPRLFGKYLHLLNDGYLVQNGILNATLVRLMTSFWMAIPGYWEAIYQLLTLEIWCRIYIWQQNPKSL